MNPLTMEWIEKAEEDFALTQLLIAPTANPMHGIICFHAQQCIEKYLKAYLQELQTSFPKTHDLEGLLDVFSPKIPDLELLRPHFADITLHAVDFRYPGRRASDADAQLANRVSLDVRTIVRKLLGIVS